MEAQNDKSAFSDFFSGWSSNIDEYFCKLIMLFEFAEAHWPFLMKIGDDAGLALDVELFITFNKIMWRVLCY